MWVYNYLKKVPTPTVPDALSVLKTKQGDCNEHAVLAGLSRERERFAGVLPLALEEARRSWSLPCDPATLTGLDKAKYR